MSQLKLSEIVQSHDLANKQMKSLCIERNLGDGYLLKRNRLYRNLRQQILAAGYDFKKSDFAAYDSFPLAALDTLLTKRKIPVRENVMRIRQLSRLKNSITLREEFPLVAVNNVLHESAHAYARLQTEFFKIRPFGKISSRSEQSHFLSLLIEESFANVCDVMVWANRTDRFERFFLASNSFHIRAPFEKMDKWSEEHCIFNFGLLFFSFLHANFLFKSATKEHFHRSLKCIESILSTSSVQKQKRKNLFYWRLFQEGFELNPVFRLVTTEFQLQLLGYHRSLDHLADFDFMKSFETDEAFRKCLTHFCLFIKS